MVFEGGLHDIAVDDMNGLVYWKEGGDIKQATLNGSSIKVVSKIGKLNVTSLHITHVIFVECLNAIICISF